MVVVDGVSVTTNRLTDMVSVVPKYVVVFFVWCSFVR